MSKLPRLFILALFFLFCAGGFFRKQQIQQAVAVGPAEGVGAHRGVKPMPPPAREPDVIEAPRLFGSLPQASSVAPVMEEFATWIDDYLVSAPAQRAALLSRGIELAKLRRPVMLDLIQNDPESALALAVTRVERVDLPASVLQFLEQPVSARAELAVMQSCLHPDGVEADHTHELYRATVINDQEYRVYVYGARLHDASLRETSLHGFALDQSLAVAESRIRVVAEGEPRPQGAPRADTGGQTVEALGEWHVLPEDTSLAEFAHTVQAAEYNPVLSSNDAGSGSSGVTGRPSQSWTHGNKSLLVILVDFSDLTGVPINKNGTVEITPSLLDSVINDSGEVRNFLQNSSFGKTDLVFDSSSDVTGVLRMPNTAESYAAADATTLLHTHARAAALSAGFDAEDYDRVAVVFSNLSGLSGSKFTFGGRANVIGSNLWINGYFDFRVVGHELGHTYGLRHSNYWQVSGSDPVDLAGSSTEYGDPFDLMGDGDYAENDFSHWNKSLLQWIPDAAVDTILSDATVRLYRFDEAGADLNLTRAVKVVRDSTRDYWIGYRRALDSNATDNGAYVLWGYNSLQQGNLLDLTTPGSNPYDAPLAVGSTFFDSAAGIRITNLAQGGSGANEWLDVSIDFLPRLQWGESDYIINEQGAVAELTVTRSNQSVGAVSVNYSTSAGTATAGADYTSSSGTLNWADGDMSAKTISIPIVADAQVEGTENFTVSLTGATGGVVVPPADATVTIADPGARDTTFAANHINNSVYSIAPLANGQMLIAGAFSSLQDSNYDIYSYGRIARINSDGSIDTSFDPGAGADASIDQVQLLPDGKILIIGRFTEYDGVPRNRIARLLSDGSLDTSFDPGVGVDDRIYAMLSLPNGNVLIAGMFTHVGDIDREYLALLDSTGALDTDFVGPDFIGTSGWRIESIALQADGKFLLGGVFYLSSSLPFQAGLCRVEATGALDASFDGVMEGAHLEGNMASLRTVEDISVQIDGKMLISGSFSAFNDVARAGIARLHSDGSVDRDFVVSPNDSVETLRILPDGNILIGGNFTDVSGTAVARIAKLSSDGTVDAAFAAAGGHAGRVYDLALQPDGNILLGGVYTSFQAATPNRPLWRFISGLAGLPGVIELSRDASTEVEGTTANITVKRIGGSLGALTLGYATVADDATPGLDYTDSYGVLTWADGDSSPQTIHIPIHSDAIADTPESFVLNLGVPQIGGALLGERQQTVVSIETAFNAWKEEHFTLAELQDPMVSGDTANPDHDAYGNLAEFAFGSDPRVADTDALPQVAVQEFAGSDYLMITFNRRAPTLDLEYTVQSESELSGDWLGSAVQVGEAVNNFDGTETVTYRDTEAVNAANVKRFLRVNVSRTE